MLHLTSWLIKEHVGMLKLSDTYDIISLNGEAHGVKATLLLAAGLAVDVIYKEK